METNVITHAISIAQTIPTTGAPPFAAVSACSHAVKEVFHGQSSLTHRNLAR